MTDCEWKRRVQLSRKKYIKCYTNYYTYICIFNPTYSNTYMYILKGHYLIYTHGYIRYILGALPRRKGAVARETFVAAAIGGSRILGNLHTNIGVTECLNKVINNLNIYDYKYVIVLWIHAYLIPTRINIGAAKLCKQIIWHLCFYFIFQFSCQVT